MERHFTYFQSLFPGEIGFEAEKFVAGIVLAIILFFLGKKAASKISNQEQIKDNLIPKRGFRLFDFFDVFCEGFIKFHDSILGPKARKYMPLNASIFLFIFFANFAGLIPGMPAITTTVWVNVGIALVVFFVFNIDGVKENGLIGYLKHFAGGDGVLKIWYLIPIGLMLFCVEIFSTALRVVTLNVRMYWNIAADHIVINTLGDLMGNFLLLIGPILYAKGLLVSLLQALVFTILTMVYILIATQHEEEH